MKARPLSRNPHQEKEKAAEEAKRRQEGHLKARVILWVIKIAAALGLLFALLDPDKPQGGINPQVWLILGFVLILPPAWQGLGCLILWLGILVVAFQAGMLMTLQGIGSMLVLLQPIFFLFWYLKPPPQKTELFHLIL
jgi:membrane-bound ClpP family serine protease